MTLEEQTQLVKQVPERTEVISISGEGARLLALQSVITAQQTGITAVYIDCKHTFDTRQANSIGVDIKKLVVCQPDTMEQALKLALQQATQPNQLLIIDSMGEVARGSQLLSLFLVELVNRAHLTKTTLIFTHVDPVHIPMCLQLYAGGDKLLDEV
jgi:hypothetical protein